MAGTQTPPLVRSRRRLERSEETACLATHQTNGAYLLAAARGADSNLDVAPQPQENSHQTIRRETTQLPVEEQRNLRPRFSRFVGDLHLRHVALVDDALNLGEQIFLADEGVPNPRL